MPVQPIRKPSQNLYDKLKAWEGCVLNAYKDSAGIITIGVGSTIYKDGSKPQMGQKISQVQADELLAWEVERKAAIVDSLLRNTTITQNQFDSLVSFAFNVGIGALENSTLLKRVKANPNDPFISDAFLMWTKITLNGKKVVNKGLVSRRKKEIALYFS